MIIEYNHNASVISPANCITGESNRCYLQFYEKLAHRHYKMRNFGVKLAIVLDNLDWNDETGSKPSHKSAFLFLHGGNVNAK